MSRPRGEPLMVPQAEFRSYYGRPILKPPAWDWKIPAYMFAGGLSAGSTMLAAGADLTGRPALRRASRLAALASLAAGTCLLVTDLGRPERFHHMLRVAKPTSPMNVGSWVLTAYAPGVGAAALAELLPPKLPQLTEARRVGSLPTRRTTGLPTRRTTGLPIRRVTGLPTYRTADDLGLLPAHGANGRLRRLIAALARPATLSSAATAPAVASYTAVLLSQTAVPAWHQAHPYLPFVFTGSAAASAGGLGMVLTPVHQAGPARAFAISGGLGELAASTIMQRRLGLHAEPYNTGTAGRLRRWSAYLTAAGLVATLAAGRSRPASIAAGACLLAGSALQRFSVFQAGVASTQDPKYVVLPQRQRLDSL